MQGLRERCKGYVREKGKGEGRHKGMGLWKKVQGKFTEKIRRNDVNSTYWRTEEADG